MKIFLALLIIFSSFHLSYADSATLVGDTTVTVKARVLEILSSESKKIPGTEVESNYQKIKVEILEGGSKGSVVEVENDYLKMSQDDIFYLRHTTRGDDGYEYYSVDEPYRLKSLAVLLVIFVATVLLIGGFQGLRGMLSLAGSVLVILYVLLPAILSGFSPILVSVLVSSVIIVLGSYITHGFNKTTSAAVLGMIVTVVITGAIAVWSVSYTHLSGFGSEEAVYLNLNNRGSIDILGILLSGIMIGLLGVLYDVAIGQSIAVEELHRIAPNVERSKIFTRAIRIGREHIGALVNTLAIAYVGASLPLLLLFGQSGGGVGNIINRELFATEIVRTLVGSMGLVIAVPITTLISVFILVKKVDGRAGKVQDTEGLGSHTHFH